MMNEPSCLWTAKDVATWLNVPTSRVNRLARQGRIPCVVLPCGDFRFNLADLDAWVASLPNSKNAAPCAARSKGQEGGQ